MKVRKLYRCWVYFKRAHANYFALVLSLINFITITYTLIFVNLLNYPKTITYLLTYALVFTPTYILTCTLIGWLDYRRGTLPEETKLTAIRNPFTKDVWKLQGEVIEAIAKLLEKEGEKEKAQELRKNYREFMRKYFKS